MGWIFALFGAFAICGAALDWDWLMNHRKAQLFLRMFGRTGTRIFYGALGTVLVVLGLLAGMGIIKQTR